MRIVLSDKEWYYGRYILWVTIFIVGICGGIFMYSRNTSEKSHSESKIPKGTETTLTNESEPTNSSIIDPESLENTRTIEKISVPNIDSDNIKSSGDKTPTAEDSSRNENRIAVAIQGAVKQPGMYWLDANSRLQNLIELAGGPLPNAELRYINLAAPLIDGTTVVIPEKVKITKDGNMVSVKGPTQPVANIYYSETYNYSDKPINSGFESKGSEDHVTKNYENLSNASPALIDLNTATQKELETLPGIGPVLANSIIEYRKIKPFQSIDELLNVSGIGPKRFEKIRHLVTVSK